MPAKKAKTAPVKTYPNTREDMEKHFGIVLTDEQIFNFCQNDDLLKRELPEDECDTMFRDHLIGEITERIVGPKLWWPTNGDADSYSREFYAIFAISAQRNGIKLTEKWDVILTPSPEDILKAKICGQATALRALEVAIVGDLSVLLVGPRGGGKQFLTEAFPEVNVRWMHSCPCGALSSIVRECTCTAERRNRWLAIMRTRAHNSDIVLDIPMLPYLSMDKPAGPEFPKLLHVRISRAKGYAVNLKEKRIMEDAAKRTEEMAVRRMSLPKSILERVHTVANAVADLDASPIIKAKHMVEAALYRGPHWMNGE